MIYLVEDDPSIAELERYALKNAGLEASVFPDGTDFWAVLKKKLPQLVILDWMLPGESGMDILTKLRAEPRTAALPVLLVTAKDTELDIVKGLDAGADDFLTKPFGIMEFISRVRALMRRAGMNRSAEDTLCFGNIMMEKSGRRVSVNGNAVELTYKEYALLELFLKAPGKVITREHIWAEVWNGDAEVESRTMDMAHPHPAAKAGGGGRLHPDCPKGRLPIGDALT